MCFSAIISGVAAVAGLASSYSGMSAQKDAQRRANAEAALQAKYNKKIGKIEKDINAENMNIRRLQLNQFQLNNGREIQQSIRQQNQLQALNTAAAASQGLLQSSSLVGGNQTANTSSRLEKTDANQNALIATGIFNKVKKINDFNNQITDLQTKANMSVTRRETAMNDYQAASSRISAGFNLVGSAESFGRIGGTLFNNATSLFSNPWQASVTYGPTDNLK